jgi:hypothetical protein
MSQMTHAVLITMEDPKGPTMSALRQWCLEKADRQTFEPIFRPHNVAFSHHPGGAKVFCDSVYAVCGNYFPHEELIKAFPTFGWGKDRLAEATVLILRYEGSDNWHGVDGEGQPVRVSGWGPAARHCFVGEPTKGEPCPKPGNDEWGRPLACRCACENCVYARAAGVLP